MTGVVHLPARLQVQAGVGDLLTIPVTVQSASGPVDISGWTLEADSATAEIVDGPAGRFDVTFLTEGPKTSPWSVRRSAPSPRLLLSDWLHVHRRGTDQQTGVEVTLTITDTAVTVQVAELADVHTIHIADSEPDTYRLWVDTGGS